MSIVFELDLRPTVSAELFPALYQAYLKLKPGTRLRAILEKNPRQSYMGFVEAGIAHRIARLGDDEWEWTATRTAWEPMGNGPGVHHVGMSPDGQRLYAVDRERTLFMFDAALQRLTASVSLNKGTSHLAVHPRSGRVYVCERSTDSMVRLDAENPPDARTDRHRRQSQSTGCGRKRQCRYPTRTQWHPHGGLR